MPSGEEGMPNGAADRPHNGGDDHRAALAIAASTGGPAALEQVFQDLQKNMQDHGGADTVLPPVFITQHLSAPFNALLAERLATVSGFDCAEAFAGEKICAGRVYVAPADMHMTVHRGAAGGLRIRLMQTPPQHFCRPAADPMLQSLAAAYGENLLAVILTGMGKDGLTGCQHVAAAGGAVWVQDASSSVVWGMPGAVAQSGISCRVMPLHKIGPALAGWMRGGSGAGANFGGRA